MEKQDVKSSSYIATKKTEIRFTEIKTPTPFPIAGEARCWQICKWEDGIPVREHFKEQLREIFSMNNWGQPYQFSSIMISYNSGSFPNKSLALLGIIFEEYSPSQAIHIFLMYLFTTAFVTSPVWSLKSFTGLYDYFLITDFMHVNKYIWASKCMDVYESWALSDFPLELLWVKWAHTKRFFLQPWFCHGALWEMPESETS